MKTPKPTLRAAIVAALMIMLVLLTTASVFAQTAQRTHTVQAGDTLYSIARLYNVSVDDIAFANGITNPALIFVGQVLVIPGTGSTGGTGGTGGTQGTYTVVAGDTLFSIARRFNTTVAQLQSLNNLGSSTTIFVGQVLRVPAASTGATATAPAATATTGAGTAAAPTATTAAGTGQRTHTVAAGETLFRIALRYGVTVAQIQAANNLGSSTLIFVGQVLTIPGSGTTAPTATQAAPTATQGTPAAPTATQAAPTATQGTPAAPTATQAPPTATQGTPAAPTATPTQTSATGAPAPVVTLTPTATATTPPPTATSTQPSPDEDPTPTAIARPGSVPASAPNLLENPGFEGATREVSFSTVKVVAGWEPFYCDQPYTTEKCPAPRQGSGNPLGLMMGRPEFSQSAEPARLRGGSGAQQWFCFWRACQGGVYQVVETRPGALCEVGAYVQSVSAEGESEVSTVTDNSIWRIRVDLAGGTQAFSPAATMLVSPDFGASAGHYDRFALISFTFTATNEQTAIYFENQRIWPIATNASYIDEAYLRCTN